jgi:hypothetical protein
MRAGFVNTGFGTKGQEAMKFWKSILVVAVVALATGAWAQPPLKAIGVFFDEDATSIYGEVAGGLTQYHTAYVCAVNMEQMVGGAAFKLVFDPEIHLFAAEYPNSVELGDIKAEGAAIGLNLCQSGYFGDPVVLAVLTLWTGNVMVNMGEISVVAHETEGGILVTDCNAVPTAVSGLTSFLTVTTDEDATSWGGVKSLYQ